MSIRYGQQPMGGQARGHPPPVPPKTTSTDKATPASLSQVCAMAMVYRRLLFVFSLVPVVCVFAPILINLLLVVVKSTMPRGLGWICLSLAILSSGIWCSVLYRVAPSPEALEKALQSSQVKLPLFWLAFYCAVFFCIPDSLVPEQVRWTLPVLNWSLGIRPAFGVLFINLATLFRFVGRGSFVRCSTVPLVPNPFIQFLKPPQWCQWPSYWTNPTVANQNQPSMVQMRKCGRRFQFPTLVACGANFAVTAFFGLLLAEYIALHYYQRSKALVYSICLWTLCLQLLHAFTRHELNPRQYNHQDLYSALISGRALKQIATQVTFTAALSMALSFPFIGSNANGREGWNSVIHYIAISAVLGFYAAAISEATQSSLFVPSRLDRFVWEVTSGRDLNGSVGNSKIKLQEEERFVVQAALYSLCYGDSALCNGIAESTASLSPSYLQLETCEARRNKEAIMMMAKVVLGMQDSKRPLEVSLEEDTLRISFLESLGGYARQPQAAEADPYPLSQRHREAIEYWVISSTSHLVVPTQNGIASNNEPKGTVLTRALAAFAGGLGVALAECAKSPPNATRWVLRPGALVAAEYCAIALSRIFLVYFEHTKKSAADFRRSQLSSLTPTVLNSLFYLDKGVLDYANYREHFQGKIPPQSAPGVAAPLDTKELHVVQRAIAEAAKTILPGSNMSTSTKDALDTECFRWVNKIVFSQQSEAPTCSF